MTVACILCSGTDYARNCARGQCAAQQLDLTDHPVDVLKDLCARMGFPPMSPEAEAEARRICDELVPSDKLPDMAALIRSTTAGA
jgi:hypothetical protein